MIDGAAPAETGGLINPLTRLGERVAALEAKHDALKEDTAHTRTSIHSINTELTKIFFAEERCSRSLEEIKSTLTTLAPAADAAKQFAEMRDELKSLILTKHRGDGAWWLLCKLALIFGAVIGAIWTVFETVLPFLAAHVSVR